MSNLATEKKPRNKRRLQMLANFEARLIKKESRDISSLMTKEQAISKLRDLANQAFQGNLNEMENALKRAAKISKKSPEDVEFQQVRRMVASVIS